jgi:hypothetical protein
MSIQKLSLQANLSVSLQKTIAGLNPVKQGPNQINADLSAIDLTVYTQAYFAILTTTTTLDLTSFTDLAGNAVTLTKVLAMVVQCEGGTLVITPGASNGLSGWFFPTSGVTFADGDSQTFMRDPGKTPVTVDSTHKTITFTITGATVSVCIIGG